MYDNLTMPWDPRTNAFPSHRFVRYEWNRNGNLEDEDLHLFGGGKEVMLKELGEILGTASMVTRWREANAELVGTDNDCASLTMREIAKVMDAGSDLEAIKIKAGSSITLLMFTQVVE